MPKLRCSLNWHRYACHCVCAIQLIDLFAFNYRYTNILRQIAMQRRIPRKLGPTSDSDAFLKIAYLPGDSLFSEHRIFHTSSYHDCRPFDGYFLNHWIQIFMRVVSMQRAWQSDHKRNYTYTDPKAITHTLYPHYPLMKYVLTIPSRSFCFVLSTQYTLHTSFSI